MLVEVIKRSYRRRKVGEQFHIKDQLGKVLILLKKVKKVSAPAVITSPRFPVVPDPQAPTLPPPDDVVATPVLALGKFKKDGTPRKPRGPNKKNAGSEVE